MEFNEKDICICGEFHCEGHSPRPNPVVVFFKKVREALMFPIYVIGGFFAAVQEMIDEDDKERYERGEAIR